ncbi:MAG: class I SAM-dependent methyltransferase [Bacteriovoracaceae bacterium]|nr:class I SAM-dependent methyltransferase [Bacteriovoracaceae bacterium]
MKELSLELKYSMYEKAVQCPSADIDFVNREFQKMYKKKPLVFREDFAGTGFTACQWVKQGARHKAYAIDLDPAPIIYGKKRHYAKLTDQEKKRVSYVQANVLKAEKFRSDVVVAFNFSYMIFQQREQMLKYFTAVRKSLNPKGFFFLDILGGPESQIVIEDRRDYSSFVYYWDCIKFNPINNEGHYAIHFRTKKPNKKYYNVFTYCWRLWTIPELRDLLQEAGFSKTFVWWEGETRKGDGNGVYTLSEKEDNCDAWIAYLGAVP